MMLDYDPEGAVENVGDALGLLREATRRGRHGAVQGVLEARGRETGGWRGEISGDDVRT
jgi:hypothetical protein